MKEKEEIEENEEEEEEAEWDSCGSFSGCKNFSNHRVNFMNE